MTNGYMIYKLYNSELGDMHTEFFLPDRDLKRVGYRLMTLASLKEKGYNVVGLLKVDRETYLNARLTETVTEYLYMDKEEVDTKVKFKCGMMSADVALKTLEMIQDRKWTLLKVLAMQVRRLMREDSDIRNEVALQLYDQYLKAML